MDRWEQHKRRMQKLYERASEISGFSPQELFDGGCLALVCYRNSPYYRMIGIVENETLKNYKSIYTVKFRIGRKKRIKKVTFEQGDFFHFGIKDKLSVALNLEVLLEEREQLPTLLPD